MRATIRKLLWDLSKSGEVSSKQVRKSLKATFGDVVETKKAWVKGRRVPHPSHPSSSALSMLLCAYVWAGRSCPAPVVLQSTPRSSQCFPSLFLCLH